MLIISHIILFYQILSLYPFLESHSGKMVSRWNSLGTRPRGTSQHSTSQMGYACQISTICIPKFTGLSHHTFFLALGVPGLINKLCFTFSQLYKHMCWIVSNLIERKERKGKERKGKERNGKERKGKERKGKERKGKERKQGGGRGKEARRRKRKGKEHALGEGREE